MNDYEVFLYRCNECGTVTATTVTITPSTHVASCRVCAILSPTRDATVHHAIYVEGNAVSLRLRDWKP